MYAKLLYNYRVISFQTRTKAQTSIDATHTHTPFIVIYFSLWSVRVQAGCNQRGQTANGSVTFWLSNALWPIWELSPLRIANRWSRPTPPSPSMFYKGELHGDKMELCRCVRVWKFIFRQIKLHVSFILRSVCFFFFYLLTSLEKCSKCLLKAFFFSCQAESSS